MSRRQITFVIILTAVVAVSLSTLIVTTINDVNILIEQESFDNSMIQLGLLLMK
jgi:hypothetical protein